MGSWGFEGAPVTCPRGWWGGVDGSLAWRGGRPAFGRAIRRVGGAGSTGAGRRRRGLSLVFHVLFVFNEYRAGALFGAFTRVAEVVGARRVDGLHRVVVAALCRLYNAFRARLFGGLGKDGSYRNLRFLRGSEATRHGLLCRVVRCRVTVVRVLLRWFHRFLRGLAIVKERLELYLLFFLHGELGVRRVHAVRLLRLSALYRGVLRPNLRMDDARQFHCVVLGSRFRAFRLAIRVHFDHRWGSQGIANHRVDARVFYRNGAVLFQRRSVAGGGVQGGLRDLVRAFDPVSDLCSIRV